jgi:type I restriction enzyme S subunit
MSITPDNAAPTGRKKLAQGENPSTAGEAAIGSQSPSTSNPDGAKELPAGWLRVAMKDIAESIQYGHTASAVQREDGPRFLRITDIQDGRVDWNTVPSCNITADEIPKYKLAAGDLVFARTGATTGKSFLIGECPEAVFASYLIRVRVSRDVDSRYLSAFFQSPDYWRQIEGGKRGIGQPNVNGTVLGEIKFPIAPLPEQRRIVAEIEKQFTRLEAGVAALRRVQANLKRYRAAVLKAACEGKLVPTEAELQESGSGVPPLGSSEKRQDAASTFETGEALLQRILAERRKNWTGRGKYKEPTAPDTANLPQLPEGWTWASVDQLAEETMIGLDRGRAQQSSAPSSGVPYIKMNNVTMEGRVLYDDMAYVPANAEESERFAVQAGDILFNTRNSTELVGKIGIIRNAPDGAIYNNNLMRIRVPRGVLPEFLCSQMCSHGFRQRMELVKKATTSVAAVYQKDLLPLPIALPPIAEQTRIVAEVERRLSVVEELESVVLANFQRATRLRQSTLQKAFTGTLTKT